MPSKEKKRKAKSLTPFKSRKSSNESIIQSLGNLDLSFNPSFNLTSIPVGSLRLPSPTFKNTKDTYDIINVSLTKQGKVEYIAEGQKTGKTKYLTHKMILDSEELFKKVLAFYRLRLKTFLSGSPGSIKREKMMSL